jgi:trimethylamine--corrinoid protein Co-methyltransferase
MIDVSILSEQNCRDLHNSSLKILHEIGFLVEDEYLRRILQKGGARIEDGRVFLSEYQVLHAIEIAPRQFEISDRLGHTFTIGEKKQHITSSTCDSLRYRCRSGRIRPARIEDLIRVVRLCDAIPEMEIIRSYLVPAEGSGTASDANCLGALLSNTAKHCWMSATNIETARCWFEMIDVLAAASRSRASSFSVLLCPNSPLALNRVIGFMMSEGARRHLPLICSTMPLSGGTAPFTLAGALALANSETLFVLVCCQEINEGSPFIYGPYASVMNMSTGRFQAMGVERIILGLAATQMANCYGLPSYLSVGHSCSKLLDLQAGYEHGMGLILAVSSAASIVGSVGSLDNALVLSPENMLIGVEFLRSLQWLQEGIVINEETIAYNTIKDTGPGGTYIISDHTLKHLRGNERFKSRLFGSSSADTGSDSIYKKAASLVEEIVANHEIKVPKDQLEIINRFVKKKTI